MNVVYVWISGEKLAGVCHVWYLMHSSRLVRYDTTRCFAAALAASTVCCCGVCSWGLQGPLRGQLDLRESHGVRAKLKAAFMLWVAGQQQSRLVMLCAFSRQTLPPPGQILRQRLPLHLSMTQSTCNKFASLKQHYQQTLTLRTLGPSSQQQQQQQQQQQLWVQGVPQLLTVTVQGAVLCNAHINAGSYIRPQELSKARRLLAGKFVWRDNVSS